MFENRGLETKNAVFVVPSCNSDLRGEAVKQIQRDALGSCSLITARVNWSLLLAFVLSCCSWWFAFVSVKDFFCGIIFLLVLPIRILDIHFNSSDNDYLLIVAMAS